LPATAPDAGSPAAPTFTGTPPASPRRSPADPGDTLDWAPLLGRAAASGDLGYTVGAAVHRIEGKPTTYTKYLTIWIRRPDGSWRFVLDGGNARPARSTP
jgi:hypothetical protein